MSVFIPNGSSPTNHLESVIVMGGNNSEFLTIMTAPAVDKDIESESLIIGISPNLFNVLEPATSPAKTVTHVHPRIDTYYTQTVSGVNTVNGEPIAQVTGHYQITLAATSMTYANGGQTLGTGYPSR